MADRNPQRPWPSPFLVAQFLPGAEVSKRESYRPAPPAELQLRVAVVHTFENVRAHVATVMRAAFYQLFKQPRFDALNEIHGTGTIDFAPALTPASNNPCIPLKNTAMASSAASDSEDF